MGLLEPALGSGAFALALHGLLEARAVDGDAPLRGGVLDELGGEAVRVVEPEDVLARSVPAAAAWSSRSSRRGRPAVRTASNRPSSAATTLETYSWPDLSSG